MRKGLAAALLAAVMLCPAAAAGAGVDEARRAIRSGNEIFARAEYEKAIKEYRRAFGGALDATAHYNAGVCYYELRRAREAAAEYRAAIRSRPDGYPKASYALGVVLEDLGEWEEAAVAYRAAIDSSGGGYPEAHYRLGLLRARAADYEGAAALFTEAVALSGGDFPTAHNNLGVMLARRGLLAEAEREFETALRQEGGRYEDARRNLSLCRALMPDAGARMLSEATQDEAVARKHGKDSARERPRLTPGGIE